MQVKARYDFEVFSGKELQQVLPATHHGTIPLRAPRITFRAFDFCSTSSAFEVWHGGSGCSNALPLSMQ
jgi:hypothetical protein